jgi:carbon-monoxide dehydrogenase small subunit
MTPCWRAEGKHVLTVEGLAKDGKLHPLQEAFVRNSAPQCGYCTSAMLLVAKAFLDSNPNPTEEELRAAMCGVLCRCTGYSPYLEAIMEVVKESHNKH